MLVIVGHGPSINRGRGAWLDQQTVVRLKWAERPDAENWGTRTDFVCASHPDFKRKRANRNLPPLEPTVQYWFLSPDRHEIQPGDRAGGKHWFQYWDKYKVPGSKLAKPSSGLRAVFCAVEFLPPAEIGLVGFDRILHPEVKTTKWFHPVGKHNYAHEAEAEQRALFDLGVKITEIKCPPSSTTTP